MIVHSGRTQIQLETTKAPHKNIMKSNIYYTHERVPQFHSILLFVSYYIVV